MATKITIIGAGSVGSTIAFMMAVKGIASEIVIIDINEKKALGEAMTFVRARRSASRAKFTPAAIPTQRVPISWSSRRASAESRGRRVWISRRRM